MGVRHAQLRLLDDGALTANAPIEPVLDEVEGSAATVFVVDLFAHVPTSIWAIKDRRHAWQAQMRGASDIYERSMPRRISRSCSSEPSFRIWATIC